MKVRVEDVVDKDGSSAFSTVTLSDAEGLTFDANFDDAHRAAIKELRVGDRITVKGAVHSCGQSPSLKGCELAR